MKMKMKMKMRRRMAAVVVAAFTAGVAGCTSTSGGHSFTTSGGSSGGSSGRSSDGSSGGDSSGGSGSASTSATTPGPLGVVGVTLRGTNGSARVSCIDIDTEFEIYPEAGGLAWTASPRDTPIDLGNKQVRAPLAGVSITPAQGVLAPGQHIVVHVSGSVPKPAKQFWVWVTAPNGTGLGGRDVGFSCNGR